VEPRNCKQVLCNYKIIITPNNWEMIFLISIHTHTHTHTHTFVLYMWVLFLLLFNKSSTRCVRFLSFVLKWRPSAEDTLRLSVSHCIIWGNTKKLTKDFCAATRDGPTPRFEQPLMPNKLRLIFYQPGKIFDTKWAIDLPLREDFWSAKAGGGWVVCGKCQGSAAGREEVSLYLYFELVQCAS